MNRTRRAFLCAVITLVPVGFTISAAHADPPGGGSVGDDTPTEPAPWRWACAHPRAWVNNPDPLPSGGILYVDGGRVCAPEDVLKKVWGQ
jgi:hypothetical protein